MRKHGKRIALAGIGAELLYSVYIYCIAPSTQVAYRPIAFLNHGLKLAGGALGALLA